LESSCIHLSLGPVASSTARLEANRGVDLVEWASDGRTLFFKGTDVRGLVGIWSVTEGKRPRLLVRFPPPDVLSTRGFATDGKRFYFTLGDRESDVFVAEVTGR